MPVGSSGRILWRVGRLALLVGVSCVQVQASRPRSAARPAAPAQERPPPEPPAPRAEAPAERAEVDPEAILALRASASQPALPLVDATVVSGLTTIALLDTARSEARGLSPEGGIRQVQLAEGQRAAFPLDLLAGECLTVVAHGGLGVREVDAFVVAGSAPDGEVLGQDLVGGPLAIVGGQRGCLPFLAPARVEVVVVSRRGQGRVLVAAFRGAARPDAAPAPGAPSGARPADAGGGGARAVDRRL